MSGVRAQGVIYEAGGQRLLHGVSLEVGPGRLAAIVGPSGAGKSTLLKVLCGIRRPSTGRALLDGDDAHLSGRAPERVGYVPQDDIVHTGLRVEAVLRYAAELRLARASAEERKQRVDRALALVGLQDRRSLKVKKLSGGQRKRVSIAVELLAEPRVLFLDEPTSGLDPGLEKQLMHTLRGLAQGERTVVVTTHIMETMDVVDLLVVVVRGHLAYAGPPAQALPFFKADGFRQIFDQLTKREPRAWVQAYEAQRAALALPSLPPAAVTGPLPPPPVARPSGPPGSASPDHAREPVQPATDIERQLAALKQKIQGDGGAS
ncbi:MAG: ABC transporter ATP-binding protein [Pseudomonadota bacterium]